MQIQKMSILKIIRNYSTRQFVFPIPEFNTDYLCNPTNKTEIQENITKRKGIGDIDLVQKLHSEGSQEQFLAEAHKIPNQTHNDVSKFGEEPRLVKYILGKPDFGDQKPLEFATIARKMNLVRTEHLGNLTGHRSYFFQGELAELEQALIRYTLDRLKDEGFKMVSVPDILPRELIERCGMNTKGERTQVYSLNDSLESDLCLSGTSEMSLAGFLMNKTFNKSDLPLKITAVSRCYRAETSNVVEERGIYRVHYFTKVEMFGVTTPEQSDTFLEELRRIEEENFTSLNLHCRVLDMPPHELGAPAFRKYDIEAWLPGRNIYGEVSSCSNCTDYQSRRLGIKYKDDSDIKFAHTLNGTACAIPRMMIALVENNQQSNGTITVPEVLVPYINDKEFISKNKKIPQLKLLK